MADTGTPPEIPAEFQIYNSYVEDPKWQRKFSIIWASALGAFIVFSLPHVVHHARRRKWALLTGWLGVREYSEERRNYQLMKQGEKVGNDEQSSAFYPSSPRRRMVASVLRTIGSVLLWSPPGIELNVGQLSVILAYLVIVLVCIIFDAPLMDNPNRAGFLALAQLPVVFLFATKNSILSLLLGPGNGYEKLNFVHRWSARCMFLGATVHGSLWIRNHLEWDIAIIGQQKETSGIAAFGVLCVLVLTSLRPVRRYFYQVFFIIHVLGFVAFFITICYHTIYAPPWIFPPLAFYGFDILLRLFRYRIKDATLIPVTHQMTLIRIPNCDDGWLAGQHVRLRVFFSGRVFESHPLTILSAPPSISSIGIDGILLGARVSGDWTSALNEYARSERQRLYLQGTGDEKEKSGAEVDPGSVEVPVQVMIDGPYGGCSVDLGKYESVLLFAGGSGVTFTIGLLDDIVGRCVALGRMGGERTKRIEFAWCIRSFGAIQWFAPMLMAIANKAADSSLDLHISIFVTCLCDPESVPPIPNSDVVIERPSVHTLLKGLVTPPLSISTPQPESDASSRKSVVLEEEVSGEDVEAGESKRVLGCSSKLRWVGLGGGVAVCASGPESLTREAANAVARIGMKRGVELGGVALHTELFAM